MLILTRKVGEAIAIGDQVTVRLLEIKGGQVKLGVMAPHHVAVHREEVYSRILEENRKAASQAPANLDGIANLLEARGASSPPDGRTE